MNSSSLAVVSSECNCTCSRCEDPAIYRGHCGKSRRGCGFEPGVYEPPRRATSLAPTLVEPTTVVDLTPEEQALLAMEEAALGREVP